MSDNRFVQNAILEAVTAGVVTAPKLRERLGFTYSQIMPALDAMIRDGRLKSFEDALGRTTYSLPGPRVPMPKGDYAGGSLPPNAHVENRASRMARDAAIAARPDHLHLPSYEEPIYACVRCTTGVAFGRGQRCRQCRQLRLK